MKKFISQDKKVIDKRALTWDAHAQTTLISARGSDKATANTSATPLDKSEASIEKECEVRKLFSFSLAIP